MSSFTLWSRQRRAGVSPKLGVIIPLALFYLGVAVLYLKLHPDVGMVLLIGGLALAFLVAPLEYALGALCFAFLGATTLELSELFLALRWAYLLGGGLILTLRFFLRRRDRRRPAISKFEFLVVVFLVFSAATLGTATAPLFSATKLAALSVLFFLVSQGGIHLTAVYGPAAPHRLLQGLLPYPLAIMIFSLPSYFAPFGARVLVGVEGRFIGYWLHPNVCGAVIALMLPWVAGRLWLSRPRPPWAKLALLMAVVILSYFLSLTGSRASLLGVLAAAVFFTVCHANRKIAAAMLLAAIFLSTQILIRPELPEEFARRYLYKHKRGLTNVFQSRIQPWRMSQARFSQHPWMGMGFGVSSENTPKTKGFVRSGPEEAGSSVWGTLVQVGILATTPLFLAILLLLGRAARFAQRVQDPCFTSVFASVLALGLNAIFEGWLIAPGSFAAVYFWVQCFFLAAMMSYFRPSPARRVQFAHSQDVNDWAHGQSQFRT